MKIDVPFSGVPTPSVVWWKDEKDLESSPRVCTDVLLSHKCPDVTVTHRRLLDTPLHSEITHRRLLDTPLHSEVQHILSGISQLVSDSQRFFSAHVYCGQTVPHLSYC